MPYVNIQITKEGGPDGLGASAQQKRNIISGVTRLLQLELDKEPNTTHVVITEVPLENWGVGGLSVPEFRAIDSKG